jgi:uncharacterized alkaline shock family protein YloU
VGQEVTAPAERGTLIVEPRAVERIAAAAATEVEHIGGAARRVLSVAVGDDAQAPRPQVDAAVDGSAVRLAVICSVAYPHPVATVTDRLRTHLVERVSSLTGLTPRSVRIAVAALTADPGRGHPLRRELS